MEWVERMQKTWASRRGLHENVHAVLNALHALCVLTGSMPTFLFFSFRLEERPTPGITALAAQ